jgi:hypothetical protein
MRVSDSNRVLFVHVPKTGGSTIDKIFDQQVPDARKVQGTPRHTSYRQLLRIEPGLADYWSCGFVRNPWARMVSWWAMTVDMYDRAASGHEVARHKVENLTRVWGPLGEYRDDFSRFVMEGTANVPRLRVPQVKRLTAPDGRRVEFIGRVENFVHDVNVVREKVGLEPVEELPRANKSSHGHYSDYYDSQTRDRVAELYESDIEAFGYAFETHTESAASPK